MKSQFHYDYPRVILAAFFAVVGYAGKTAVGFLVAVVMSFWIAVIIVCSVVRVLRRKREP